MNSIGIAKKIITACTQKKITISGAESCTGGLVSSILTRIPGCSNVFAGSVVSYANEAKESILRVPAGIIEQFGAVSEPCAQAMAEGAQRLFMSDIAFAITGIAGPGGGTSEKPVGTVWFSIIQKTSPQSRVSTNIPQANQDTAFSSHSASKRHSAHAINSPCITADNLDTMTTLNAGVLCRTWQCLFKGSRTAIQKQSAHEILQALLAVVDKL